MKLRMVFLASSVLTLAACASTPEEVVTAPAPTSPPATPAVTASGPIPGTVADFVQNAGDRVYFGYDSYNMSGESRATLDRQAAWLSAYPSVTVQVAGNCDERGTREYNLALGARRANAARDYLVAQGVDGSRITTISFGKERPIDPRSNEEAWALNRNSQTIILSGATS